MTIVAGEATTPSAPDEEVEITEEFTPLEFDGLSTYEERKEHQEYLASLSGKKIRLSARVTHTHTRLGFIANLSNNYYELHSVEGSIVSSHMGLAEFVTEGEEDVDHHYTFPKFIIIEEVFED